jgi:hypothetical protein
VPLLSRSPLWDHFQYHYKQLFPPRIATPTGFLVAHPYVEILIFEKYPLSVPEIITGTTLSVLDQLTQPAILNTYFNRYSTSFFKSISSLVARTIT